MIVEAVKNVMICNSLKVHLRNFNEALLLQFLKLLQDVEKLLDFNVCIHFLSFQLSEPDIDSYIKQVNPNFLVDKNKENDHDSRNFLNYSGLVHRLPQQSENNLKLYRVTQKSEEHMVLQRITQQSEENMEDCFSTSELAVSIVCHLFIK